MGLKLKYIDIQNFQGYKRARIPLSDFTIVVGLSSSGKTTIFRAAQFVLYGEWDATYPNDPSKPTAVAFEFENGTRVLRIRKDGQNQAAIIRDGETTKYKSFGTIIPGIQSLINTRAITIGAQSVNLNFSLQDDPPFMVSAPRPAKAQWIGRLYGAHIITQMLREMAKDKKHTNSKREDAEERLQRTQAELRSYDTVEQQELLLGQAEALLDSYNLLKQCQQEASILQVLKDSLNRDKWVTKADLEGVKESLTSLAALRLLKYEADAFAISKAEHKKNLGSLKIDVVAMRQELETLQALRDLKEEEASIHTRTIDQGSYALEIENNIKKVRAKLDKEILASGKCPVCEGEITKDHPTLFKNIARLVGSKTDGN